MNKVFTLIGSVAIVAAVVAGLLLTGSPVEQRYYRFDAQRVRDLQKLARAVEWWW